MTTLISLAARDFIAVACDSLATSSADVVFPGQLAQNFFDEKGELKLGEDGKPLLRSSFQLWEKAESIPVDNLPSVTKLFDLEPYRACLLFAGASRIGDTTIRNLVETFKSSLPNIKGTSSNRDAYTMEGMAKQLNEFILKIYDNEIPEEQSRPSMDIILSGYSEECRQPELWRVRFSFDRFQNQFTSSVNCAVQRKEYNVIFGGQYDVVQRIVNGIDNHSTWSLKQRSISKLEECFSNIQEQIRESNPDVALTKPDFTSKKWDLMGEDFGGVKGNFMDVGSLSEQAGIDLVYFLVSVMIQAQAFADAIPTVGGKIHVAILTKDTPFRWVSEEAYTFEGKPIPKFFANHA